MYIFVYTKSSRIGTLFTGDSVSNSWIFREVVVKGIKVDKYGNPYDAAITLRFVNGQAHVEDLISKVPVTDEDLKEIDSAVRVRGFDQYTYSRFKNNKRIVKVRKV